MHEKYFLRITISFLYYKNFLILNHLFLGNDLYEIYNSLLKSIKYNLTQLINKKTDIGINSKSFYFRYVVRISLTPG